MKASELIKELEKAIEERGDLDVEFCDFNEGEGREFDSIRHLDDSFVVCSI